MCLVLVTEEMKVDSTGLGSGLAQTTQGYFLRSAEFFQFVQVGHLGCSLGDLFQNL